MYPLVHLSTTKPATNGYSTNVILGQVLFSMFEQAKQELYVAEHLLHYVTSHTRHKTLHLSTYFHIRDLIERITVKYHHVVTSTTEPRQTTFTTKVLWLLANISFMGAHTDKNQQHRPLSPKAFLVHTRIEYPKQTSRVWMVNLNSQYSRFQSTHSPVCLQGSSYSCF